METSTIGASRGGREQRRAREQAEGLEREAAGHPDARGEILLEAAGQWAYAGEDERALRIYDELIATGEPEDAQWAVAEKIDVLVRQGREQEAEETIAGLRHAHVQPGPAGMVAEFLESQGRLEEALEWFNIACRDFLSGDAAHDAEELDEPVLFSRSELQGRARVRKALGLAPDELDLVVGEVRAELIRTLEGRPGRRRRAAVAERPKSAGSFFVRADVERAFAEGLVQEDEPYDDDVDSYLRRVERGWRAMAEQNGVTSVRVLPVTVDDLLAYGEEHGRDPRDQQVRVDHLQDRLRAGAPALSWPPGRNDPCWCDSGRKYKKCCGTPGNR